MPIYIYKGNNQVSTNAIRNNKVVKAIYAKEQGQEAVCVWGIDTSIPYDQMFTYSITDNKVTITGLKPEVKTVYITVPNIISNQSVSSIRGFAFRNKTKILSTIISDRVTNIGEGAFSGCSSLESIVIPFVGAKAGVTSNDTYQYPFGYIFGTNSYTGGVATGQYYYGRTTSSEAYSTYYIPSSLKSVTIAGGNILYGAFYNCSGLTSITILDGVTSIGRRAFYNCTGLTSVTIGNGVTSIGYEAFSSCTGLTSITGSATNVSTVATQAKPTSFTVNITSGTSIGSDAFFNCKGLKSVTMGNSVTDIHTFAFEGCEELTSITIPNSVTSISKDAFRVCLKLQNIYITDIGAFCNISGLDNLMWVSSSNKKLYINNELATSITIPNGVTAIQSFAFSGCSSLTSVTIGGSVTSIATGAFRDCTGLTSITIPNSVTSIGNYAFRYCIRLTSITFNGTKAQWNAITKGSDWNYNTGNYTIHCTDGDIPK